ncbi:hypothetical protein BD770DRAFT_77749 [Pilaira anomala]|nr:hypothetical protein BD770DRAFT_77749 [Pilaira anomala]
MESAKSFQQRSVVNICAYISKYCELYINSATTLNSTNVKDFHNFFPTLLVCIFGSPTTRGWIQTETSQVQDTAIKNFLSIHGQFYKALLKLAKYPEYSLDLITDSLPADVKKVLNSGSTHLLPKVYENCSYLVTASNMDPMDIRTAATRQSTLLPPASLGGDRKIKFNMLQFYLYYFVSVPTWPRLNPPVTQPTYTTPGRPMIPTQPQLTPYQIPGSLRSIGRSVYGPVLEEYLTKQENPFFVDAIIELWIRTTWISTNQSLSPELMTYITQFVQYVVRQDLRLCPTDDKLYISQVYRKLKDELYMLISRLAFNWRKNDDYLQVVDIWSIWVTPWRLGAKPLSMEKSELNPIRSGWSLFILDNLIYYLFIVNIFLQRTSTFQFKNTTPPPQQQSQQSTPFATTTTTTTTTTSQYTGNETKSGQLRILYRIINLVNTNGLLEFLGLTEHCLLKIQTGSTPSIYDPFKTLAKLSYGTETMDFKVYEKLAQVHKILVALEGMNGIWKPKGLYAKDMNPRSEYLLKTLIAINDAIAIRDTSKWLNTTDTSKNRRDTLKDAYDYMNSAFKVVGINSLLSDMSINNRSTSTTTTPSSSTTTTTNKFDPLKKNEKTNWLRPNVVGLNGFLSPEERDAIKQGRAICSEDHIPALGDRAVNFVRSYEIPELVRWTVQINKRINHHYDYYLPPQTRPKFLPNALSVRFLATRIYFLSILFVVFLIIYTCVKKFINRWF